MLSSLARKAMLVATTLDSIGGISCNPVQGGKPLTRFYTFALLEDTGICVVPGSGFGQKKNTHNLRITFVPQEEHMVCFVSLQSLLIY